MQGEHYTFSGISSASVDALTQTKCQAERLPWRGYSYTQYPHLSIRPSVSNTVPLVLSTSYRACITNPSPRNPAALVAIRLAFASTASCVLLKSMRGHQSTSHSGHEKTSLRALLYCVSLGGLFVLNPLSSPVSSLSYREALSTCMGEECRLESPRLRAPPHSSL